MGKYGFWTHLIADGSIYTLTLASTPAFFSALHHQINKHPLISQQLNTNSNNEKVHVILNVGFFCSFIALFLWLNLSICRLLYSQQNSLSLKSHENIIFFRTNVKNFIQHSVTFFFAFAYCVWCKSDTPKQLQLFYVLGLSWCLIRVLFIFGFFAGIKTGISTLRSPFIIWACFIMLFFCARGFDLHFLDGLFV